MAGGDQKTSTLSQWPNWQRHPFATGLSDEQLRLLASCAMPVQFEAGQTIFLEGEPANRFYLILAGEVAVQARTANETVTLLTTLISGDVLGWSWMFPPYKWHFDAMAVKATQAVFFYGTWLRQMADERPEFGCELLKRVAALLIQRLQATRRQLLFGSNPDKIMRADQELRA